MFGLTIPSSADTVVQIRLTLSRGRPPVAWQGAPEVSDDAVIASMLANQGVVAYVWAALNRDKLRKDEEGFVHIPARVVAVQHGAMVFNQRVSIPLRVPRRSDPSPTASHQAQRDMLAIVETALSTMHRNVPEAIAQVGIASINALREINAAQSASLERAQQTLERLRAMIADANRTQVKTRALRAAEASQDPAVAPETISTGSPRGRQKGRSEV